MHRRRRASAVDRPARAWSASVALPGRRHEHRPSSAPPASRRGRAARARRRRARARRPRRAASLRSRVSTLPRSSTTSRSGRAASSCARRRSDAGARRARPRARARAIARRRARRAGRRARGGGDELACPSASSPGTSLAECTARSISPASSAASMRVDPARLVADRARPASPEVVIVDDLRSPAARSATQRAWASASALPRVPTRRARQLAPRRRSGRTSAAVAALGRRRRSSSPNSSRSSCRRAWRCSASSWLHAHASARAAAG